LAGGKAMTESIFPVATLFVADIGTRGRAEVEAEVEEDAVASGVETTLEAIFSGAAADVDAAGAAEPKFPFSVSTCAFELEVAADEVNID
jgi:hypothetical protein